LQDKGLAAAIGDQETPSWIKEVCDIAWASQGEAKDRNILGGHRIHDFLLLLLLSPSQRSTVAVDEAQAGPAVTALDTFHDKGDLAQSDPLLAHIHGFRNSWPEASYQIGTSFAQTAATLR
jgi:hypothetical protein